ncbi:transcriptional regulator [Enterobacter kobei]|uniref:transcriptional regulator n=1 Tax=Enterobacter kobei TaxID=208224 RepID=UPI002109D003|nr:transcriptional regulator [Enterobacter kobei]MCQ4359399.1 transcriptional regulator [Enterobacter kobei]HDC4314691.1 transcriptional regulator [Enterobacter kobei]HDC4328020.1 transcriptional regulator [Enterobacter kobei]HDC4425693.1 transcriptional regulator [Enterobacter kobei]HDC4598514.1 transcriptional regulator [Enterobacter kobei]
MTITDITYGIPAEVWPRDYKDVERAVLYYRAKRVPIRVTLEDGQSFSMYAYGILSARNKLDLTPTPDSHENRVRVPLERVSLIETVKTRFVQKGFVGRITIIADDYRNQPSKRDFFKICRNAHNDGKLLRVYMADGREIEGEPAGFNATQINIRQPDGTQLIALYDWVERILAFN